MFRFKPVVDGLLNNVIQHSFLTFWFGVAIMLFVVFVTITACVRYGVICIFVSALHHLPHIITDNNLYKIIHTIEREHS